MCYWTIQFLLFCLLASIIFLFKAIPLYPKIIWSKEVVLRWIYSKVLLRLGFLGCHQFDRASSVSSQKFCIWNISDSRIQVCETSWSLCLVAIDNVSRVMATMDRHSESRQWSSSDLNHLTERSQQLILARRTPSSHNPKRPTQHFGAWQRWSWAKPEAKEEKLAMQNPRAAATHKKLSSKSRGIKANPHGRSCARQRLSSPVTKGRSWKLDPPSFPLGWSTRGVRRKWCILEQRERRSLLRSTQTILVDRQMVPNVLWREIHALFKAERLEEDDDIEKKARTGSRNPWRCESWARTHEASEIGKQKRRVDTLPKVRPPQHLLWLYDLLSFHDLADSLHHMYHHHLE